MLQLALFVAGVLFASAAGFTAPVLDLAALGFLPLAAGCVWAAYNVTDEEAARGASTSSAPKR